MRDRPSAAALRDLMARNDAPAAARALASAIVAREDRAGAAPVEAWAARLAALHGDEAAPPEALERRLARDLRAGSYDRGPRRATVRAHLIATVRAKLAEIDPALIDTWPLLDEAAVR
jgi:Domain of unknown function (DUF6285)